jgi:hypothetical protein
MPALRKKCNVPKARQVRVMTDEAREAPEEDVRVVCEGCGKGIHTNNPDHPALCDECDGEERTYYVPWQAIGSVVVKAHDEEEAVDLANERFGIRQLAVLEERGNLVVDDLTFNHKWGPGVEETDDAETPYED